VKWLRFWRVLALRLKRFLEVPPPLHLQNPRLPQEPRFHPDLIGEREKLMARAQELGIGYIDLDRVTFAGDLEALVPADVLTRHQVLPVKRERTNIWLACSDPKNMDAIDEIKALTGCRVIPVFAQPEALREAIDALARS
jgi:type IV pilus assembly protein PilB